MPRSARLCRCGNKIRGRNKSGLCFLCFRQPSGSDSYFWRDKSHNWKGGDVGRTQLHRRINDERGRAKTHVCICGGQAEEWSYIHGTDKYDAGNYRALCVPCHRKYDLGRKETKT